MPLLAEMKSELFKALGHPTRIQILELLAEKELCVCTIYEELEQSQPNISQHLSKLKNADIVESRKEGLQAYYTLKDERILEVMELAKEIIINQLDETRENLTEN